MISTYNVMPTINITIEPNWNPETTEEEAHRVIEDFMNFLAYADIPFTSATAVGGFWNGFISQDHVQKVRNWLEERNDIEERINE